MMDSMIEKVWELIKAQFDKLLLTFLLLVFIGVALRMQGTIVDAMLDNSKTIIGALLGLITGAAMRASQAQTRVNDVIQGAGDEKKVV